MCSVNVLPGKHQTHTHAHTPVPRTQPAVVNEMKEHIEVVALFLLAPVRSFPCPIRPVCVCARVLGSRCSMSSTVYFSSSSLSLVILRVNFCERLINSHLRVRYYNWHFHAPRCHLVGIIRTRKSHAAFGESTLCQTSREWTHMSCPDIVSHVASSFFNWRARERIEWKGENLKFEFHILRREEENSKETL